MRQEKVYTLLSNYYSKRVLLNQEDHEFRKSQPHFIIFFVSVLFHSVDCGSPIRSPAASVSSVRNGHDLDAVTSYLPALTTEYADSMLDDSK